MMYSSFLKRYFRNNIVHISFILLTLKCLIAQTNLAFKPISADIVKVWLLKVNPLLSD